MINLRYHIVSLVAVFLALAIGVIAGSTVIDQQIVKDLQRQRNRDANFKARLQEENDGLRREIALWEEFGRALLGPRIEGALAGRSVLLLTVEGGADVGDVQDALRRAGAIAGGRLVLRTRLRLEDATDRDDLARALGVSEQDPALLRRDAARRIAARLRNAADPRQDGDLLRALERGGFLEVGDLPAGDFPARGSLMLYLSSGEPELAPPSLFGTQLLEALAGAMSAAVAEPLGAADSLVERVRADGVLSKRVATVDDVDTALGLFALVSALRDLARGGEPPHYGVRRGATSVAPVGAAA